jgi:hypothetical protein
MTFTKRVTSITQDRILPKIVDQVLSDSFMLYRYISNGKKWSGETLKRPIKVSKNTLGGSFSGLDQHNTGVVSVRETMSYDLRGWEMPVTIPGLERVVNQGEAQVVNLVRAELESAQMDMLDDIASICYSDGTGNDSKDFNGLANIVDDGTTAATIGGLSRTTYPVLNSTRTASSGSVTLAKLATLFAAVSAGSAASQRPTIVISSEAEFNLYESLLAPTVQANYQTNGMPVVTRSSRGAISAAELKGTAGFTSLIYRGIPWVADEKAPAQTIWMLNENYIEWYGARDPELQSISLGSTHEGPINDQPTSNTGFQWTGFLKPIDQYADVAHIYLLGNLTSFQPRRHGRLTGVTTAA